MVSSVDRVTQARQRKQAMRKAGSMKDGGEVMGAEQTHQLLLPSKFEAYPHITCLGRSPS